MKLVKHVDKPDPGVELNAKAQEGMTLMQGQKYAEARKVFEELLAKYPDVHQLNAYIAQTYAGENNMPKAIEYMKTASEKDPDNAEMKLVLADLMMEGGDKAAALEMMKTIDVTKIKNPLPLINGSISLINSNKTDEAMDLLNKVATQFPTQAEMLLLPRPRLRRGEEVSRGEGRPREVRVDGRARRARAARREEAPRAAEGRQVVVGTQTTGMERLHPPRCGPPRGGHR